MDDSLNFMLGDQVVLCMLPQEGLVHMLWNRPQGITMALFIVVKLIQQVADECIPLFACQSAWAMAVERQTKAYMFTLCPPSPPANGCQAPPLPNRGIHEPILRTTTLEIVCCEPSMTKFDARTLSEFIEPLLNGVM